MELFEKAPMISEKLIWEAAENHSEKRNMRLANFPRIQKHLFAELIFRSEVFI